MHPKGLRWTAATCYLALAATLTLAAPTTVADVAAFPVSGLPRPPTARPLTVQNAAAPVFLESRGRDESFLRQWDAVTGQSTILDLPRNFNLNGVARTTHGFFVYGEGNGGPGQVALHTAERGWLTVRLQVRRERPRLLVLADQSILVFSGKAPGGREGILSLSLERVWFERGGLAVERLPDLPGPERRSFSALALADGRVMALGGTASPDIGCGPCFAETYLLDTKQKRWSMGPRLREARSDASAIQLPDGTVMVAGGWTAIHDWSRGPTRSVEVWRPGTSAFVPARPMASASAMHQVQWFPGQPGRQLLLGGGNNSSLQLYDLADDRWRIVGEPCQGKEHGQVTLYPFLRGGLAYVWMTQERGGGLCRDGSDADATRIELFDHGSWSLLRLRNVPASDGRALRLDAQRGWSLYRDRMAVAPLIGDRPALVMGGSIQAGMTEWAYSGAVDAVWPDGRIEALPALNQPRSQAWALTLGDGGRLVVGGLFGHRNDPDHELRLKSAEWLPGQLPLNQARWITLENHPVLSNTLALGTAAEGGAAVLTDDQRVHLLAIRPGARQDAPPFIDTRTLPPLLRARRSISGPKMLAVKELADGRVVVAGGSVQVHRIALMHDTINSPEAPDEYVGIGEFLSSRRHEIFDPTSGEWRSSAPSRAAGENAVILDDGRVVKLGRIEPQAPPSTADVSMSENWAIELSNTDGTQWAKINQDLESRIELRDARLFEANGEVFLAAQGKTNNTGGGSSYLHWFDTANNRWEVLWEAGKDENWRAHVGRVLVRQLNNGKRVVLPVNGW